MGSIKGKGWHDVFTEDKLIHFLDREYSVSLVPQIITPIIYYLNSCIYRKAKFGLDTVGKLEGNLDSTTARISKLGPHQCLKLLYALKFTCIICIQCASISIFIVFRALSLLHFFQPHSEN